MATSLSIIIPCHNEEQLLPICLEHLLTQAHELGDTGEIIVAVNGSTDNSYQVAAKYSSKSERVTVIQLAKADKKAAMNAALRKANNRYVLFTDADSFLEPYALSEAKKYLSSNRYAIIGGIRKPIVDESKINASFIETYYMIHYAKRLSLRKRLSVQGWFMTIDRKKLPELMFPDDGSADDIWLSAHVWTTLGPKAIGYIPFAIGTYVPPSTRSDMTKQLVRHRSNHRLVRELHPEFSAYFSRRSKYYNDTHIDTRWMRQVNKLGIDFNSWITPYEEFISYIERLSANVPLSNDMTWERITSSKSLPNK